MRRILRLELRHEPALARRRAGRALLIAQQQNVARALQQVAHPVRGHLAALRVVGGDKRHDLVGVERRVDHHRRDARASGLLDGPHDRRLIERRDDDARDVLAHEAFDHLHLLLAVVLAQRALPADGDLRARGVQLALGLDGAGVNGFPEFVRGAFRNNGNGQFARLALARAARRSRQQKHGQRGSPGSVTTMHDEVPPWQA